MQAELHLAFRIFDSVCNGITICDAALPDIPLIYMNPAFERMTGYELKEVVGLNCRFLQGDDTQQPSVREVREAIRGQRETRVLLRNYHKKGTAFWNELYLSPVVDIDGTVTHFVGVQNDVTKLVEERERLDHLAHHDGLTGLANRVLLMEYLSQALLRAHRSKGQVAVLFFDLDNFKNANDMFGHVEGDRLLGVVAQRLREATRACETVARLGGDEFIVVLEELSDVRQPRLVMERLVTLIAQPVEMQGQQFSTASSVGLALYPEDGQTAEALIKVADFRMYAAKHETRLAELSSEIEERTNRRA